MRLKQYILDENTAIDDEFNGIMDALKKDCKPFLDEYAKSNCRGLLYRGSKRTIRSISKMTSRLVDRKPKDTSKDIHDELNRLFKKKYGWKVRNGIFTTNRQATAKHYGRAYIFFPIGEFDFVWSDYVKDLYTEFDEQEFAVSEFKYSSKFFIADDEYSDEYGEWGKGHWEYNGDEIDEPEIKEDELEDEGKTFDDNLLKWISDKTWKEYIEQVQVNWENERKDFVENVVDQYFDKYLKSAIDSKSEVMFNCKHYYLVHPMFVNSLTNALKEL